MKRYLGLVISIGAISVLLSSCIPKSPPTTENKPPPIVTPQPPASFPVPSPKETSTDNRTGTPSGTAEIVSFADSGYTKFGDWYTEVSVSPASWHPGTWVDINAKLKVSEDHLLALGWSKINADGLCLLVTAERTFDADGWLRLSSDERMSTLVTPTGLAIEGGVQGAVTNRFGYYDFRTPVDEFVVLPLKAAKKVAGQREAIFAIRTKLPDDLPPGIYRVRLDYGITVGKRYYNLNGEAFARRPFFQGRPTESHIYSPPVRASGRHVNGRWVDASTIKPRVPWVLLRNYNSNGYRGVVADEDKSHFALSDRNIIPDDVILPLYDGARKVISYSLEPQFPADTIELRSNIPWDYSKGEMSVKVTGPDGQTVDLGTSPFVGKQGEWPTSKQAPITKWKPSAYGEYTIKVTGWLSDIWGNRYEGGGTYRFWIANRMTLATATFQGMAYPVGSRYGRDLGFSPAVPADVEVTATLFVNSDPKNARTISYKGKASPSGVFGAAQGSQSLTLDAPGEYFAYILARYTDADGNLWVSTMRHAGVVYSEDSPIVARGKKLYTGGKYLDRGDTNSEGYLDSENVNHLVHINYPFQSGDVLLIASEQQGSNKIEPVLTYELKNKPAPYDARLNTIGITNLRLQTSNGYSPHLFPEYITDWAYYYAGAPRPGFMSRFLVGEDGVRAPYWPTSPNSFGGQFNASNNGDLPGDIYRLIGGVVLRKSGEPPAYAGYLSSAFILPGGSNNNRVIAAGSENVPGPYNMKARFFLVSIRPGMMYEAGAPFVPVAQIDPVLPVNIKFTLNYPDGRRVVSEGAGDKFGSFAGSRWILDIAGVYKFSIEGDWQGYKGEMPGLPASGGDIYVVEKERPAGATGLKLNLPQQSTFNAARGLTISGTSTAETVYFAAVIPGAVIDQGTLKVNKGKFEYVFNPVAINQKTPTYDIINLRSGTPEIKDVVHLTFFSKEVTPSGAAYHSFVRLIFRGNTVLYTR